MKLKNKIVLITASTRGIGLACVKACAKEGATVYMAARNLELAKEEADRLNSQGCNVKYVYNDASKPESYITMTEEVIKDAGRIDVLINNAALSLDNNFLDKTKEEFMKVLEVNLVGPFLLIQKLYNLLSNSKIINIASTDGINTYSKLSMDYSASKAGLINLTKSLALELEDAKVYALCPNWVDTEAIREMDPSYLKEEMNRIGQKKLINAKEVSNKVIEIIENDLKSGSIIVMED